MKICIDARNISNFPTGIGNYALSILTNLSTIDKKNKFLVILNSNLKNVPKLGSNFKFIKVAYPINSLRNLFFFHFTLNRFKPQIYHSLYSFLPLFISKKIKGVITVHDLMPLVIPFSCKNDFLRSIYFYLFFKIFQTLSVFKSNRIISVSNQTRDDICKNIKPDLEKVIVIYNSFFKLSEDAYQLSKVQTTIINFVKLNKFFLSFGNTRPHKNIQNCLKAFKIITKNNPDIKYLIFGRGDKHSTLFRSSYS